jgi:hypothetical protein
MRRTSDPTDVLSRRIFVTLTRAEAETLVQWHPATDGAAARALAKIRTAAGLAEASSPEPSAVAPLRARDYRPGEHAQHVRQTVRRRSAEVLPCAPKHGTPPAPDVDDYVPWRDEAGGIYK